MNIKNSTFDSEIETITVKEKDFYEDEKKIKAFAELEQGTYDALETYSNVHRGSGLKSMISTSLFEQARDIVLKFLGLNKANYVVIFCTPRRADILIKQVDSANIKIISSNDIGLSIGVKAIAIKRNSLPKGAPFQTGGGTTKLISQDWIIWASAPDKFEAGTPAIINVIAFSKALLLIQKYGQDIFRNEGSKKLVSTAFYYHDDFEVDSGQDLLDKLKENIIGKGFKVPTVKGIVPYINLDNSASTPTFSPVWNAFRNTWKQNLHTQKKIIQETKSICSEFLGAPLSDYDVIFTSNTTESINLTAESLSRESEEDIEPVVINSLLEHSSNDLPWRMVPNCNLISLSVNPDGFVNTNELENLLQSYNQEKKHGKKRVKLIAICGASNVLGVCNNIKEISQIAHKYKAKLLVDAAQLIAHRKINMKENGIDYLAFSAHKVYAPFGCGVLVARKDLLNFNSKELGQIQLSGEENASGIAALGKALALLQSVGMDIIQKEEHSLTKQTILRLSQNPAIEIYGIIDPESPEFKQRLGVIVFTLKGMMADQVAKELAIQGGIGIRNGCLCAHIIVKHILKVGPKLEQFQRIIQTLFPKISLPGVARISLGIENSEKDLDELIHVLNKITKTSKYSSISGDKKSVIVSKNLAKKQMENYVKESSLRVF